MFASPSTLVCQLERFPVCYCLFFLASLLFSSLVCVEGRFWNTFEAREKLTCLTKPGIYKDVDAFATEQYFNVVSSRSGSHSFTLAYGFID